MKKLIHILLVAAIALTLIPGASNAASSASGKLVVYTSIPTTQLNMMIDLFNDQYPGIVVDVLSSKSAELVARVQSEAGAPRGDVLLGEGLSSLQTVENLLTPYTTSNAADLHTDYIAESAILIPVQLHVSAMIVNPAAAKAFGADIKGWESLKDEQLSGRVLYMDPARFSPDAQQTAFINTVAESANIKAPSAPSFVLNAVNAGQFAVGITSEDKAIEYKAANDKLEILYAQEGVAVSASYAALLSGSTNSENAKLFIDFVTSKQYQQAAADQLNLRSVRKDVNINMEGVVPTSELRAVNYDYMILRLTGDANFVATK